MLRCTCLLNGFPFSFWLIKMIIIMQQRQVVSISPSLRSRNRSWISFRGQVWGVGVGLLR